LGNVGDSSDLAALERATADLEPLIAEHAKWAIQQIRSRHGISLSIGKKTGLIQKAPQSIESETVPRRIQNCYERDFVCKSQTSD